MKASHALWIIAALTTAHGAAGAEPTGRTVLGNVTVVSPERAVPLAGAWVVLDGGRIEAVHTERPSEEELAGARVIDGTNLWVTPGLIDSHVHLASLVGMLGKQRREHPELVAAYREQLPRSYLYFGFTSVVDLSVTDPDLIASLRAAPLGPSIFTCSEGLSLANGFRMSEDDPETRLDDYDNWLYDSYRPQVVPDRFDLSAHTPEAVVGRIVGSGGICVKTYYENGFGGTAPVTWDMPTVEIVRDVVAAAHEHSVPVLIHANSYESQRFAVDAGVDVIAHGMWHWGDVTDFLDVDELPETHRRLLEEIAARGIGYQPTIQVLASQRALFDTGYLDDRELRHVLPAVYIAWLQSPQGRWHRDALVEMFPEVLGGKDDHELYTLFDRFADKTKTITRVLAAHDARLLFGTDTPSGPAWGNPPGYNGYLEMLDWADAGVSPARLLEAATRANAEAFHLEDELGTVEPGKRADLLVLDENPLRSVEAWSSIRWVVKDGAVIDRARLSASG